MKYLAAALAILAVVAAVVAVRYTDSRPSTGPPVAAQVTVARRSPTPALRAAVASPTAEWVVATREEAIEIGRVVAGGFEGYESVLIDATLLPHAVATDVLREPGVPSWDGPLPSAQGMTAETEVWLVRMRGAFVGPTGPDLRATGVPEKGWLYAIINPRNGLPISRGFSVQGVPVEEIPARYAQP